MVDTRLVKLRRDNDTTQAVVKGLMDRLEVINTQIRDMREQKEKNWGSLQLQLTSMRNRVQTQVENAACKGQLSRWTGTFPDFDGSNLEDWVYRCERYFELEHTAGPMKVRLASIYMYGKAFRWHYAFIKNRGLADVPTWTEYVDALTERFGKVAKNVNESVVVIKTGANGAITEDKNETVDHLGVGNEGLAGAEVHVASDDAYVYDGTDVEDVNRIEETDTTEGTNMVEKDREKVKQRVEWKEADASYLEGEEDDLFWNDSSVHVLIRIRRLNNVVEVSREKLFRIAVLPMVQRCFLEYNSCILDYGQTGSGKAYTMIGEICEVEGRLNDGCWINPSIFEYPVTRIRWKKERIMEEKLTYRCKYPFMEIHNEPATKFLEPSPLKLQQRENIKKGVFVEYLMEYNIRIVKDVIKLLLEDVAGRKRAMTHMNSKSGRPHNVFTSIIGSHWEKDSMTHLRIAKLTMVDLDGSVRQKGSGTEGGLLKEGVNMNTSLSTLILDYLDGNSKTMVIANVSPSIGSTNETLGTLRFAQCAKLIQNNEKVNEDASGNVSALQRQSEQLKDQLSFLVKIHYPPGRELNTETPYSSGFVEQYGVIRGRTWAGNNEMEPGIKSLVATLLVVLRRKRDLQQVVEKWMDEIEKLKILEKEKDEKANQASLILRLQKYIIKRLTSLTEGELSVEVYLLEHSRASMAENHLLQGRINRDSELIQLALLNTQLTGKLHLYPTSCEQGKKKHLLAEVSSRRSQLWRLLIDREQHMMRRGANKHWIDKEFAVGKPVYDKQLPGGLRTNQELALVLYWPYKMLDRIGGAAYKLDLQADPNEGDAIWELFDDLMQKNSGYTLEDKCGFEGRNLMHGK